MVAATSCCCPAASYMSPEAFDPEMFGGVGPATDVWSLGCCLVEMASGVPPWDGLRHQEISRTVCDKRETPSLPDGLPAAAIALLSSCFKYEPAARPKASAVHQSLVAIDASQLQSLHSTAEASANASGDTRPLVLASVAFSEETKDVDNTVAARLEANAGASDGAAGARALDSPGVEKQDLDIALALSLSEQCHVVQTAATPEMEMQQLETALALSRAMAMQEDARRGRGE